MDLTQLKLGAVLEMKKPHACGGDRWEVVRTGADRKIKCMTCGRIVVLLPDELLRRVRRIAEEV